MCSRRWSGADLLLVTLGPDFAELPPASVAQDLGLLHGSMPGLEYGAVSEFLKIYRSARWSLGSMKARARRSRRAGVDTLSRSAVASASATAIRHSASRSAGISLRLPVDHGLRCGVPRRRGVEQRPVHQRCSSLPCVPARPASSRTTTPTQKASRGAQRWLRSRTPGSCSGRSGRSRGSGTPADAPAHRPRPCGIDRNVGDRPLLITVHPHRPGAATWARRRAVGCPGPHADQLALVQHLLDDQR